MQTVLELSNVGFELGRNSGRAELAIEQADRVGLLLQKLDHRRVQVAGAGDVPQQFGSLVGIIDLHSPGREGRDTLPGREAERDAGVFGHAEPVGDPGKHRGRGNGLAITGDQANADLGQADCGPDPDLAHPGVLPQQPEKRSDLLPSQGLADIGTHPERIR